MANKTPSAGDPIEARCTKCRTITNHTIIAMTDAGPAKVQCNTCNGQHKYRSPVAASKSTTPRKPSTRRSVDPKIAECKEWETLRPEMNSKQAITYSMTTAFKVKNLMQHPTFGLGIVQRVAGPQKVEVLFEDGLKTMRCK